MKKAFGTLAYLSIFTLTACPCRPEISRYSLYDSSIRHEATQPATFTVFSNLALRGGDYASSPERRPEYSEVYVFDETKGCNYYEYDESRCPLVWKAVTQPEKSPWKITYGEDGNALKTTKGPQKLRANRRYRVVVAHREAGSRCVSEVGSHIFSFREDGRIKPVDSRTVEGYVPLPDQTKPSAAQQIPSQKERLNRLAKQYEKLNGHPLLPLSYGKESVDTKE